MDAAYTATDTAWSVCLVVYVSVGQNHEQTNTLLITLMQLLRRVLQIPHEG